MIQKVLGSLIFVGALIIAYLVLNQDLHKSDSKTECTPQTPAKLFINLISEDLKNLQSSKGLPAEWENIAKVEIEMGSTLARALLGRSQPNIQTKKNGLYSLEMTFVDLPDDENPGVIIQMSLFNIKTKNKIFEIGRTYTMNQLNKVPAKAKPTTQNK